MGKERFGPIGGRLECPSCSGEVEAVSDGEETNFLCRRCGCCWNVELGWVRRVDPAHCPGCAARSVCLAARPAYGQPHLQETPTASA